MHMILTVCWLLLIFIPDYLFHHKRRTKIGSSYSSWHDIIRGVPQGSLLRVILTILHTLKLIPSLQGLTFGRKNNVTVLATQFLSFSPFSCHLAQTLLPIFLNKTFC